jgi:hypothetical protein
MTNVTSGRVNTKEPAANRYSRPKPAVWSSAGLAAIAAASWYLVPLADYGHAASSFSWHAARKAATPLYKPIQAISGFNVASASGPSGQPLPLRVQLPENPTASYSFLMIRNLPADFRLSVGFGTKNYWAVSLNDAPNLLIIPPDNYVGTLTLEVLLVKTIGTDPVRVAATATFEPGVSAGRVPTAARPDTPTAALPDSDSQSKAAGQRQRQARRTEEQPLSGSGSTQPAEMNDTDRVMLQRGDEYLRQGDIASARLLYQQLARKNIAEGALGLGSTYDPEYLASLGVRGLRPEVEEARKWYEKARALGSPLASERLAAIGQR